MFSKRKGRSGRGFNKKRGCKVRNVEVSAARDNQTSKEGSGSKGGGGRSRKKAGHVEVERKNSSSNSDNASKSGIRTRRRRRRRMRARQNQEHGESRKTKGRRKRKTKQNVKTTKETVGCSESSWSGSHLPMSISACGLSHSSNFTDSNGISWRDRSYVSSSNQSHYSHGSRMDCFDLPWANLDVPMDLSQVDLEVKNSGGVDFELLAQKNHQRWCANLVKAQE